MIRHTPLILISLILGALAMPAIASQKAITDDGNEVLLHKDGTWEYFSKPDQLKPIPFNDGTFLKPDSATFKVKSNNNNTAFWINPAAWSFSKGSEGEPAEYDFELREGDLYAMAITEEIEFDLESLADIAFENALEVAPDIRILKKE